MTEVSFRILNGLDRGKVITNLPTPVSIGRELGNTIRLEDVGVSRFHAEVRFENENLVVADLGSTNGTKVNGETIDQRVKIHRGDTITVGRSTLLYGTATEILELDSDDDPSSESQTFVESPQSFDRFATQLEPYEWVPLVNQLRSQALVDSQALRDQLRLLPKASRYYLIALIGRGAMAKVFAAWDPQSNTPVALKLFEPRYEQVWSLVQRFQNEADAMTTLDRPGVVKLLDKANQKGRVFIVMNLIMGPTLQSLHRQWQLNYRAYLETEAPEQLIDYRSSAIGESVAIRHPADGKTDAEATEANLRLVDDSLRTAIPFTEDHYRLVAQLGLDICSALACSHNQGILHRDIKPSNLILDADGKVWVADFGLANMDCKLGARNEPEIPETRLTRHGDLLGTVAYLSPGAVDGRYSEQSDLYALGVTLFELALLEPVWGTSTENEILKRLFEGESPDAIESNKKGIPAGLASVINHLIRAEDPDNQASASQMSRCFQQVLNQEQVALPRNRLTWFRRCRNAVRKSASTGDFQIVVTLWVLLVTSFAVLMYNNQSGQRFVYQTAADSLKNTIQDKLDQAFTSARIIRQFANATDRISSGNFETFVTPILQDNPEFTSVGFAHLVADKQQESFDSAIGRELQTPFSIRDFPAPKNDVQRSTSKVVVTQYVAAKTEVDLVGLNLASNSRAAQCIKQTGYTGQAAATGPIDLGEFAFPSQGVLVLQRVDQSDGRRAFAMVSVRFSDMLKAAKPSEYLPNMFLQVKPDALPDATPIYQGDEDGRSFSVPSEEAWYEYDLRAGEATWRLTIAPANPWNQSPLFAFTWTLVFATVIMGPLIGLYRVAKKMLGRRG